MFNFNFSRKKKKGCLDGKTEEQKIAFFNSLSEFATTDQQFFKEQYSDLTDHEKKLFENFILESTEQKKTILKMLNVIEKLLKIQKDG